MRLWPAAALRELSGRLGARNRRNVTCAGLGTRTSASGFEASERGYGQARADEWSLRRRARKPKGSCSRESSVSGQNGRVPRDRHEESRSVVALKTVSRIRGRDEAQHYQWANRGVGFCGRLGTAARAVSDWDEVVKLNGVGSRTIPAASTTES